MARSYLVVVALQAVAALATVGALRWLAVHVAPEEFGRYSLYLSVVSAGGLFIISWPNAALLRFGREEWTSTGAIGTTLGGRMILFVTCTFAALALAWCADPWLRTLLKVQESPFLWIAIGLSAVAASELVIYLSQAVGRTEAYGYGPATSKLAFLAFVIALVRRSGSAAWSDLALSLVASSVISVVVCALLLPKPVWAPLAVHAKSIGRLVRYSRTLPLAGVSTYVVNWVDAWVIRNALGVAPVGIYTWAYQVMTVAMLAFAPVAVVLTPKVVDVRVSCDRRRMQRYVDIIVPCSVIAAAAVCAVLPLIETALGRIVGPAYVEAVPVVTVLVCALPFQLIAYLLTPLANAHEALMPRIVAVSVGIALINTAGDLILVPRLGMVGAAAATTFAFAAGALMLVGVIRHEVAATFHPLWRYAAPASLMLPSLVLIDVAGRPAGTLLIYLALAGLWLAAEYRTRTSGRGGTMPALRLIGRGLTFSER